MTTTICYYIPYSAKAMSALRKIADKFGATWSVNENEEVTIQIKAKHLAKVEKILVPLV